MYICIFYWLGENWEPDIVALEACTYARKPGGSTCLSAFAVYLQMQKGEWNFTPLDQYLEHHTPNIN